MENLFILACLRLTQSVQLSEMCISAAITDIDHFLLVVYCRALHKKIDELEEKIPGRN